MNIHQAKYEVFRKYDKLRRFIAWHMPKGMVMWCYMRVLAHATGGKYGKDNISEIDAMTAIERWTNDFNVR